MKTRRAGTSAAILTATLCAAATSAFAGAAFAQDASASQATPPVTVTNSQTQSADIFAGQQLHVVEADQGATSSAAALGNEFSAVGVNQDVHVTSAQTLNANVSANAQATVDWNAGPYLGVTSSATGNTATMATSQGEASGTAVQTLGGPAAGYAISAQGSAGGAYADQVSVDSTAIGNTVGWSSSGGYSNSTTTQSLRGPVSAVSTSTVAQAGNEIGLSATAVGNNVTVDVAGPADATVTQSIGTSGGTTSQATISPANVDTAATAATATGNNIVMTTSGDMSLASQQNNDALVFAGTSINADNFSVANASAYGVGNSVLVDNVGPSATLFNGQSNTANVSATATLTGGQTGGAEGIATASAIGNAISSYVCATCSGGVSATNTQSNEGGVSANSSVNGAKVGLVSGQSSAVGNHAGFVVKTPGS